MHKPGWVHTLRWGNPCTDPPGGLPRVLGTWADREPTAGDFREAYPAYRLGCGYSHCIMFPATSTRRKLTPEANAQRQQRARLTQEANRVRKALPLLADVIIRDSGLDWRQNSGSTVG